MSTPVSSSRPFAGRTVLVTGASSGIGAAIGRRLAADGAAVMLAARRTDRLEALAAQISAAGGTAAIATVDIADRVAVQRLADETEARFGAIDVLVNNAGLMPLSPLAAGKVEEWERMVDVNLKGVLYGIAAVLPKMQAQGRGHVINVASVAAHKVFPGAAVYCATKFAVRALSEGLRMEAGPKIRTTVISPGAVATELADTITVPEVAEMVRRFQEIAIGPEAIADAVAYAMAQPATVDVNEIVIRPTAQDL